MEKIIPWTCVRIFNVKCEACHFKRMKSNKQIIHNDCHFCFNFTLVGGFTPGITDPVDQESPLRNKPSKSYQSNESTPEMSDKTREKRSTSTASATPASNPSKSQTGSPHLPHCPFVHDVAVERLPQLPTDLASLIDDGFLHCWKSGVCLRHPLLFLLLHCVPDQEDTDRQLVITEVSPCPQGRRVLSFVVDHIDTLIREWYQELSTTDGLQPKVRHLIPCMVCERLGFEGLKSHKFTFTDCQLQSSKADTISCPKHPRLRVNLHQVAPDIMFHDLDADLLLSHDEITYEDTDSNRLGTGGFGKVLCLVGLTGSGNSNKACFGGENSSGNQEIL